MQNGTNCAVNPLLLGCKTYGFCWFLRHICEYELTKRCSRYRCVNIRLLSAFWITENSGHNFEPFFLILRDIKKSAVHKLRKADFMPFYHKVQAFGSRADTPPHVSLIALMLSVFLVVVGV